MYHNRIKVHMIGAGGIGMSGLKIWLEKADYQVSCSDDLARNPSFIAEQDPLPDVDYLVVSSAVSVNHCQYQDAIRRGIHILHRSEMMKQLMHGKVVSVTGSHGKSTTAGLLSYALNMHASPISFLIGAILLNFNTNAQYAKGANFCVVEADESDNSMNKLTGDYHLITNIEEEHIDHYGTFEKYVECMKQFSESSKLTVAHISCKKHLTREDIVYYGPGTDYYAMNKIVDSNGSRFDLHTPYGTYSELQIQLKGEHMIENAVGASTMLFQLGLNEKQIRSGLPTFASSKRRMEEFSYKGKLIIQDYANHPNDIGCVIDTIRSVYPDREIHILWEPHRFSRIGYKDNLSRIINIFREAKEILLLPVCAASEKQVEEFAHENLGTRLRKEGLRCSLVTSPKEDIQEHMEKMPQEAILIAFGSGAIYNTVAKIISSIS